MFRSLLQLRSAVARVAASQSAAAVRTAGTAGRAKAHIFASVATSTGLAASLIAATAAQHEEACSSQEGPASTACLTRSFIADAAAKASPALVNIRVGKGSFMQSSGSGFIIEPSGLILTNSHVVCGTRHDGSMVGGTVLVTLSDGMTQLRGVVQHADAASDIALVKVSPRRPLPAASLGSSSSLRPGEFVVALGAPAGLSNSVSAGIVSAIERTRTELGLREPHRGGGSSSLHGYIQTDAAINSGNSGGPLLDLDGKVIGVNTMKAMNMDGIAFAVPIDDVKRVVAQLRKHGRVLRPHLGLRFVELDASVAESIRRAASEQEHGMQKHRISSVPESGLFVMHVSPNSPAQRGGLAVGDTVTAIDGREMRSTRELLDALTDRIGGTVKISLLRNGAATDVTCEVESRA